MGLEILDIVGLTIVCITVLTVTAVYVSRKKR